MGIADAVAENGAAILDRSMQLTMLKALADRYPDPMAIQALSTHLPLDRCQERSYRANLTYLAEHGLVRIVAPIDDGDEQSARITQHGMDFLRDDGGLSAILGVVTIRLHDDTIKTLIEAKILQSSLPQPDKKRYVDRLRELPADATKHLVLKLLDAGLSNGSAAWIAIQTALGAAQ